MATEYSQPPRDVIETLNHVMASFHAALSASGVEVSTLFIAKHAKSGDLEPALKVHGYDAAAQISVTALKHRALRQGDALLIIDLYRWHQLSLPERHALLDHELTHLEVIDDDGDPVTWDDKAGRLVGKPALDSLDRPKLRIRLHDWKLEGFQEVVQRHGEAALEAQCARRYRDDRGQYVWDWDAIERPVAKPIDPPETKKKRSRAGAA